MTNPSLAVVEALDGELFFPPGVRLEHGRNLYRAYPREADGTMPHVAAFVLLRGGEPIKFRLESPSERVSLVTVFLRGEPQRFSDGEDLARHVWLFLHNMDPPQGYQDCRVTDSEPEFSGIDAVGHPRWFINLRLIHED
jgi:hypothetical protein